MIYEWKLERLYPLDAQLVGTHLQRLADRAGGRVTPAAVVADARPRTSLLHAAFEWNDAKAAEAHRLDQAKRMIGAIRVRLPEQGEEDVPVRAFVSVRPDDAGGAVYTSISAAMGDATLRAQVLADAKAELTAWRRKYSGLEELAAIFRVIDTAG